MIGTLLSGRYRLDSKLGSGGMSTVYLAQDEVLDRPVAVKLLHREISEEPNQIERFRQEARAAARLSHPNLVGVIDAGQDDGRPYIVFEYVPGETLKQRIQRGGPLPVDEAVAYAIEIGRGLNAAHALHLVHRDVKPQNVLIDPDGRARVTDFGIARSLESDGMTATGRVLGTTDYVSPEQAMGIDADQRSDVYSLGVVLYEMLSGEVPFRAETQVGVAMHHVHDPLPDIFESRGDVSAALASVIDRATSKEPGDRYASVIDMVADLERTLELEAARSGGTTGEATAVLQSVPRARRRLGRPSRVSGAGLAMGGLGIGLITAALLLGGESLVSGPSGSGIDLSPRAAREFDPLGDSRETATANLAIDGNPTTTAWATEHYATEAFGGLKDGVGLAIDAGSTVDATAIEIRSPNSGWDIEIYKSPGTPPTSLSAWGSPVTRRVNGGTRERIDLPGGSARSFLVWITKPPASQEKPGQFQMEISDLQIFA